MQLKNYKIWELLNNEFEIDGKKTKLSVEVRDASGNLIDLNKNIYKHIFNEFKLGCTVVDCAECPFVAKCNHYKDDLIINKIMEYDGEDRNDMILELYRKEVEYARDL